MISGGLYTCASVPEVDGLYSAQVNEGNPRARRVILEYAYLVSIGPWLEVDNLNVLPQNPTPLPKRS